MITHHPAPLTCAYTVRHLRSVPHNYTKNEACFFRSFSTVLGEQFSITANTFGKKREADGRAHSTTYETVSGCRARSVRQFYPLLPAITFYPPQAPTARLPLPRRAHRWTYCYSRCSSVSWGVRVHSAAVSADELLPTPPCIAVEVATCCFWACKLRVCSESGAACVAKFWSREPC